MNDLTRLLPLAPSWASDLLWVIVVLVAVVIFLEWLPLKLLGVFANWRRFFRDGL